MTFPQRLPDQPPADSLAESMCLNAVLIDPRLMHTLDIGRHLVFPEYRRIWQAMVKVHMRTPDLEPGAFTGALIDELGVTKEARLLGTLDLVWHTLDGTPRWREQNEAWQADQPPPPHRPLSYWVQRIKACSEARMMISAAQTIAERAWKVDVDGGRRAVESLNELLRPSTTRAAIVPL